MTKKNESMVTESLFLKNFEDCRRGLVGDYVYPDITCEFIDEDDEIMSVAKGFWRNIT